MKTIITSIATLIIAVCSYASGNEGTSFTAETNTPRNGDNLEKQEIQPIPLQHDGDSLLWDLSGHKPGKKQLVRYRTAKDGVTIIENEPRSNKYYMLRGDSLLLIRQTQAGMAVTYMIPETVAAYPMQYGNSSGGYFYGEGNLGNITYLRNAGFSSNEIKARGTLITPEGDTIRNVIRSHYHRRGTTLIADNFRQSFMTTRDSTLFSSDSIRHWLASDSIIHSIDRWQWHAQGYRYPVAEAEKYKIFYYGNPVDSVSRYYYYRAVDQEYDLNFDYANEAIRYGNENNRAYSYNPGGNGTNRSHVNNSNSALYNERTGIPDGNRNKMDKSDGSNAGNRASGTGMDIGTYPYCNAYPTVVTDDLTINYGTDAPAGITINLHNTAGGVVWRYSENSLSGDYSIRCPMGSIPSGDYVIITSIGKEIFSYKIIKK